MLLSRPLLAADEALGEQDGHLEVAVERHVAAGADMAFSGDLSVAILLSQRLIGRKVWTK